MYQSAVHSANIRRPMLLLFKCMSSSTRASPAICRLQPWWTHISYFYSSSIRYVISTLWRKLTGQAAVRLTLITSFVNCVIQAMQFR